ncbi:ubiquitin carboxyl-terminal hydrolase 17-like protein C [Thunnus albacares]|uniref:ubiquitin carboxyl-terminal hydrolase 17-like protein C n=1 Tax=Thunnus albacares TaxID=8236 RepID=UPI001CF66863|nr:ubiquitin carboxyl-terminal hydrolase 17-like protein C [Thunnus albacares]
MNHYHVEKFRKKLNRISISDYYGLNSPGLTCYLNSVLQVLFMTEDFREAIKRCLIKDSTTIDPHLGILFTELEKSVAKTHRITKTLGITDIYKQRDAAEYFEKILCLTSPEASKIFKGELNHKIICLKCKERSNSRNFFWTLPLAVEDSFHTFSVEKGLKAFFKKEKVCRDNKRHCNRCNKKQDADFECEITRNPKILTLLLKRFSFDDKRRCYFKLHCEVDVPQTLHMESCTYNLYALVNHFGNLMGGHYTAQIKSFETGAWYQFDDHTVKSVERPLFGAGKNSLRSYTAYLLMYKKVNRDPEKTGEGDQEARFAHSDVESEGRHDEAERGEAPVPRHQLKDDSCNGGKSLQHLNGDILKKSDDDTVWKKLTNISGEVEKQTNQRAACVRSRKEMLPQTVEDGNSYRTSLQKSNFAKPEKDEGQKSHGPNIEQHAATNSEQHIYHLNTRGTPTAHFRKHSDNSMLEQNHNSQKKRLKADEIVWETQSSIVTKTGTKKTSVTDSRPTTNTVKLSETIGVKNKSETVADVNKEGKSIKQKIEAGVRSNMGDCDVSSNGCSSSCLYSLSPLALKEPTECNSPNLCRKSSNLKRNKERVQHVIPNCKLQAMQTVTKGENAVSLRERRNAKKSDGKVKKDPWK